MAIEDDKSGESFLSRWSRRKVEVAKAGEVPDAEPATANEIEKPNSRIGAAFRAKMPEEARPERTLPLASPAAVPELPALESLTRESDFAPFMRAEVTPELRNQAMKKLFTDPHYNVMDRLDIYIDDYGKSDPIPPEMLRMMNQSKALGLFEDEERAEEAARKAALGEGAAEAGAAAADAAEAPAATPAPASDQAQHVLPPGQVSASNESAAENLTFPFAPVSST